MLIKRRQLEAMASGRVTLAFRRWRRPTVKAGGTLTTALGVFAIDAVTAVRVSDISTAQARRAGYRNRDELLNALAAGSGEVYCIELHLAGEDPRIALRDHAPDAAELAALTRRLERLDRASRDGPWTRAALTLIRDHPGLRAGDLAAALGAARDPFKRNVRKLKNLGLTESLEVGYRLSPRGRGLVEYLDR